MVAGARPAKELVQVVSAAESWAAGRRLASTRLDANLNR